MNKLRLDLEGLAVESFDTAPEARREKGTVFGQVITAYTNCTCPGCPTCEASCDGTCNASCNNTCAVSCYGTCGETCETCDDTCGPLLTCYESCDGYCPSFPC